MRVSIGWICALVLACSGPLAAQPVADPTDLDMDGAPGVAEPLENFAEPPSALVGTGTLLIDHSHHGPAIRAFNVSGFTNYLAANGWTINVLATGPVTEAALEGADVFLVPTRAAGFGSIFPFTSAEVIAIRAFLASGGGLWVLHDNDDATGVNTLSSAFGVTFLFDYVQDPTNNEGEVFWPTIHTLAGHSIFDGVDSYGYYLGDCIGVAAPASVIAQGDEDAYSFFCPVGSRPPTMAAYEGGGRAIFAGDITTLSPQWYPNLLEPEEQLLLQNIANWLLGDPPNATSAGSWGGVKRAFSER